MILFVVWVPGSVAPSLLEHLPDVLQRVDHDAEVAKALFCDLVVKVLLGGVKNVPIHTSERGIARPVVGSGRGMIGATVNGARGI